MSTRELYTRLIGVLCEEYDKTIADLKASASHPDVLRPASTIRQMEGMIASYGELKKDARERADLILAGNNTAAMENMLRFMRTSINPVYAFLNS